MGVPAKVVQEMFGQSNFGTTMNTSSLVLPPMQQEAMDKMDSFLRQQPSWFAIRQNKKREALASHFLVEGGFLLASFVIPC